LIKINTSSENWIFNIKLSGGDRPIKFLNKSGAGEILLFFSPKIEKNAKTKGHI
jgi:hypothetical protein